MQVLFINSDIFGRLYSQLSQILRFDYQHETHLLYSNELVNAASNKQFQEEKNFNSRHCIDDVINAPIQTNVNHKEVLEACSVIENEFSLSFNEIMRGDHNLGLPFIHDTDYPEMKIFQGLSYYQRLAYLLRLYNVFDNYLKTIKPELVIGDEGPCYSSLMLRMAESRGIPIRVPIIEMLTQRFHWGYNQYAQPHQFFEVFNTLLRNDNADNGYSLDEGLKEAYFSEPSTNLVDEQLKLSYKSNFLTAIHHARKYFQYCLRGGYRRYGVYAIKNYITFGLKALQHNRLQLQKSRQFTLDSLPQTPFVFFPLSPEPGANLQNEAWMCDSQSTVVDLLAKTLPAGWFLVIKDHPAQFWTRNHAFMQKIKQYPNTLVVPKYLSEEIIAQRADVIANINGTIGLRSAAQGKPVLCFNPNAIISVFPSVYSVRTYEDVKAVYNVIAYPNLRRKFDTVWYQDVFLLAMLKTSVRITQNSRLYPQKRFNLDEFSMADFVNICKLLLNTL